MTNQLKPGQRVIPLVDARRYRPFPRADYPPLAPPSDMLGRQLRDLRISVTDRCNFRCTYCMPKEVFGRDHAYLPSSDLLSFEEIARLARLAKGLGVRKVRITGGEPLLRRDVERLIEQLVNLGDLEVTLTTNGSLLVRKAKALRAAGLHRLTVSLDALDEATFRALNDVDFPASKVLEGIAAAEAAGFPAIKINMVVKRGVNDHEIMEMARRFRHTGHILRFIEFMDVGVTNGWKMESVLPSAEVVARIHAEYPLEPVDPNYPGEVAERWRYLDGSGEIGAISSVTQSFCGECSRARLSPDGRLFTCLFAAGGFDLRSLLRGGASDAEIGGRIAAVWQARSDRYSEVRSTNSAPGSRIEMSYIGG
jgi:GTP 3',8-cyclase